MSDRRAALATAAALVAIGLVLERRSFAVFGALGLAAGAGRLAAPHLHGAAIFGFAAAVGVATIFATGAYLALEADACGWVRRLLPRELAALLPLPARSGASAERRSPGG